MSFSHFRHLSVDYNTTILYTNALRPALVLTYVCVFVCMYVSHCTKPSTLHVPFRFVELRHERQQDFSQLIIYNLSHTHTHTTHARTHFLVSGAKAFGKIFFRIATS